MKQIFFSSNKQYCLGLNQPAVSRERREQRKYDEGIVVMREGETVKWRKIEEMHEKKTLVVKCESFSLSLYIHHADCTT